MKYIRNPSVLSFVAALLAFLVLTNVRWLALDPGTYQQGFIKYRASDVTSMTADELELAARQLIGYFSDGKPITVEVRKGGVTAPLFNERETSHLADVYHLFQIIFRAQEVAGLYVVVYILLSHIRRPKQYVRHFGKLLLTGGATIVGLFIGLYALARLSFAELFLSFHLISFRNDLWLLDPRTDYLVRMFPQGFWFDALQEVVVRSLAEAAALAVIGIAILKGTRTPVSTGGLLETPGGRAAQRRPANITPRGRNAS